MNKPLCAAKANNNLVNKWEIIEVIEMNWCKHLAYKMVDELFIVSWKSIRGKIHSTDCIFLNFLSLHSAMTLKSCQMIHNKL